MESALVIFNLMFAGVAYEIDEKITESSSSFSLYSRAPDL